jgi:hypothetical protein
MRTEPPADEPAAGPATWMDNGLLIMSQLDRLSRLYILHGIRMYLQLSARLAHMIGASGSPE